MLAPQLRPGVQALLNCAALDCAACWHLRVNRICGPDLGDGGGHVPGFSIVACYAGIYVRSQAGPLLVRSRSIARLGAGQLATMPVRTGPGTSREGPPPSIVPDLSRSAVADDVLPEQRGRRRHHVQRGPPRAGPADSAPGGPAAQPRLGRRRGIRPAPVDLIHDGRPP
jgi:hypothetical protein